MQGSIPRRGKRFFSSPKCLDQLWGQFSLLFGGYWGLVFPRIEWLWQEVDYLPLYVFMAWTGATLTLPLQCKEWDRSKLMDEVYWA